MDEKDREESLPMTEESVPDAPLEPEEPKEPEAAESKLEEYAYESPAEEKPEPEITEPEVVELEIAEPTVSSTEYEQGSSEEAVFAEPKHRDEYESSPNPDQNPPSSGYHYEENQQQQTPPSPPPGYHYGPGNGQAPPPPNYGYGSHYRPGHSPKRSNGMALASLILGILSIVMCCCGGFGVILGAVGIVLAILSRGQEPMETNAKAGLCLSIGGIVLGIAILILAFAMMGNDEFQSELYQRSRKSYEDYDYYFDNYDHSHSGF